MYRALVGGIAAAALLLVAPAWPVAAQSNNCPIVPDNVVAQALGTSVSSKSQPLVPGLDFCDFLDPSGTDFGVSRESGAFGPGEAGGAAALVLRYIPQLPDAARAQIDALSQVGINVAVPGYEISAVSGVGDAAVWVKTELVPGFFKDSLLVQQGGDGFSFDTDDSPNAQAQLTALAQAVLSSLSP